MKKTKQKVFVGLSGGVDSSVSALLLKKQGYEVTGVFIRGWQPDWIPCTWKIDRISAMRTAAHLEIPFVTLDLENEYKNKVVAYLLEEYKKGNTPNPDMLCNREIKFGDFLKWSLKNGADYIATGHYAQVGDNVFSESKDKEKDQTYFLSQLTKDELGKVLFPIGHLEKSEVRKIASENSLPVATRKDSQGICFVGDLEMSEFLKKELKPENGNVLDENGKIIGKHEGAILYTIGQRHGFSVENISQNQKNYYVVKKDLQNNTITVSDTKERRVENVADIFIANFSFTNSLEDLQNANNLAMRIRYRGEKISIKFLDFDVNSKTLKVSSSKFLEYAHGQFAVLYDADKVLGGGEL